MASTEEKVQELIGGGISRFLVGGDVGYDMEVAKLHPAHQGGSAFLLPLNTHEGAIKALAKP